MRITLVIDNLAHEGLLSEHGLSLLVEADGGSVVFDSGQSGAWLHNLRVLGRDPGAIRSAAVSHGHYDHTGGLPQLLKSESGVKCFAHPACFRPKWSKSAEVLRYIGMPEDVVRRQPEFSLNRSATEVMPGVTLSGEIPLVKDVEFPARFRTGSEGNEQDEFEDEQCLIVKNTDSAAVLVGCAHRGLENNILAAMRSSKLSRIELLVGGFHLGDATEDRLQSLADFLGGLEIPRIACCHCTGVAAYQYLNSKLGPRVTLTRAGDYWDI